MQQEGKKDQGQYGCGHGFRNNECMGICRKFCQRGSNLTILFFCLRGEGGYSRPSSARQRNAILMAFRWRADDGQALNSGFVLFGFSSGSGPVLLKKILIFVIFRGGGGSEPLSPSGSAHGM